jgi:hypothetical protein
MFTKFLLLKRLFHNRIFQYALLLFLFAVFVALWTERLEDKIEERLLLEIENKTLLQRETFRQDSRTITNEVNRLTNDELRSRAREWMR